MKLFNAPKLFAYQLKLWYKHMFTYPTLHTGVVDYDAYWRDKRGENIGALSDWQIERAQFVVDTLKGEKDISLLDIACGDGSILNFIKGRVSVLKMIGTDVSTFALDRAEKFGVETRILDIGDTKQFVNIPTADYAMLFEILEHVPHSEELLNSTYSKMNKGVFFSFPNTGFFIHRFRLLFGKFPMQWRMFPGEHVRYWTKQDLLWWLKALGFHNAQVHYYKGVPLLHKLWPGMFAAGFVVFLKK